MHDTVTMMQSQTKLHCAFCPDGFVARWQSGHGSAVIDACFWQLPFKTDAIETHLHAS